MWDIPWDFSSNQVGRPRGTKAVGVPAGAEHPGSVVRLAGYYRKNNDRQRFRCHPLSGVAAHKFAGDIPCIKAANHHCDQCDSEVPAHLGPPVPRHYSFPVDQAAAALLKVGQGVSYTEAARRTRVQFGKTTTWVSAQLVANWVEVLGPIVCEPRRAHEWPEAVVLDGTRFMTTNSRTGDTSLAFNVLGAWGYEAGSVKGQAWALVATHTATQVDWENLLRSMPSQPVLVVCDGAYAISNAVAEVWPGTFVKRCEHRLRQNVRKQMKKYGQMGYGSTGMTLLNDTFKTLAGWRNSYPWVAPCGNSAPGFPDLGRL